MGSGVSSYLFDAYRYGGSGTFSFYTVATDGAGNAESAPGAPDCVMRISANGVGAAWSQYR